MSIERIVAAVVDTRLLTLYREDGSTIEIPQGDPRVRDIIKQVMPVVQAGGVAVVDLTRLPNAYKEFEEKSSGLVRLFRVAKKAVAGIFAPAAEETDADQTEIAPGVFGVLPTGTQPSMAAVDEIISQAESVSHAEYKDGDTTEDHTMIAVVADETGKKTIIPEVENLKEQFGYAAKLGSTGGMEKFFARLAKVIDQRSHSVQDLLRFLEKGDLPIADDGCIVAYKILRRKNGSSQVFVDPHTKKVTQQVGSYVCVDESLVDKNRRNECSNGLHIARRGYLGSFSGDLVTMCKIRPEDVITVPHGDANKVRVCGYHILFELNQSSYSKLRGNRPATDDPETAKLLSRAIAGQHPEAHEEVRVTEQYGGGLKITPIVNGKLVPLPPTTQPTAHVALDDEKNTPARVDPKAVAEQVKVEKASGNRRDKAQTLWAMVNDENRTPELRLTSARELATHKKTSKVSWHNLGLGPQEVEKLETILVQGLTAIALAATAPVVPAPVKQAEPPKTPAGSLRQQTVAGFRATMDDTSKPANLRVDAAHDLLNFRKAAKVSWERLGQPDLFDQDLKDFIANPPQPKAAPAEAKAEPKPQGKGSTKGLSVADEARQMFTEGRWAQLHELKKAKKKSWEILGFKAREIDVILANKPGG